MWQPSPNRKTNKENHMSRKVIIILVAVVTLVLVFVGAMSLGLWKVLMPQMADVFSTWNPLWIGAVMLVLFITDLNLARCITAPKEQSMEAAKKQIKQLEKTAQKLEEPCHITVFRSRDSDGSASKVRVYQNAQLVGKIKAGESLKITADTSPVLISVGYPGLNVRTLSRKVDAQSGGKAQLVFSLRDATLVDGSIF